MKAMTADFLLLAVVFSDVAVTATSGQVSASQLVSLAKFWAGRGTQALTFVASGFDDPDVEEYGRSAHDESSELLSLIISLESILDFEPDSSTLHVLACMDLAVCSRGLAKLGEDAFRYKKWLIP